MSNHEVHNMICDTRIWRFGWLAAAGCAWMGMSAVSCGGQDTDENATATPDASATATTDGRTNADRSPVDGSTHSEEASVDAGRRDAGPPITVTAANAYCDTVFAMADAVLARCCSTSDLDKGTRQAWVDISKDYLSMCNQVLGSAAQKGRLAQGPTTLAGCAAAVDAAATSASCGDWNPAIGLWIISVRAMPPGFVASCGQTLVGRQGPGDACVASEECAPGLTCAGTVFAKWLEYPRTIATEGTCQVPGSIGARCGSQSITTDASVPWSFPGSYNQLKTSDDCAVGARCKDGECVARMADDEGLCLYDSDCLEGLHCMRSKCTTALPQDGGPCTLDDECALPLSCDQLRDASVGTCRVARAAGETCYERSLEPSAATCAGGCKVPDGGASGACVSVCGSR